jgi:hypothetical protein
MYIGKFEMYAVDDVWGKGGTWPVDLYKAGADNSLIAVKDDQGRQKTVDAVNIVGTFAYKDDPERYCMITKINDTYWVVSAEC